MYDKTVIGGGNNKFNVAHNREQYFDAARNPQSELTAITRDDIEFVWVYHVWNDILLFALLMPRNVPDDV